MNLCNFCTQLTFDLILRLGGIFRHGIHPSVFSYISRNTFSMDAKMYSKMPTNFFVAGSSDWQLLPRQPIKLRESDKSLITVENYSINISVKIKFYYHL